MRSLTAAAAFIALAAPVAAQDVQITSPADGATFAVGDVVTLSGTAAEGTATDLDLTVVLDTSGSTDDPAFPIGDPDTRTVLDVEVDATQALIGSLSDGTEVSAIEFNSSAVNLFTDVILSPGTRPGVNTDLESLSPGGGTDFSDALQQVVDNGVEAGDQILFVSDGQLGGSFATEAEAIAAAGGIVNTVALPGASLTALQGIATAGGGSFFDLRDDPGSIVDLFAGTGGVTIGLTGLSIAFPDGTTTDLASNLFGQFTAPGFAIGEGANTFVVTATFDGGVVRQDTLTLQGTAMAMIPLPASAWLLAGAVGLFGLRRRRA